MLRFAVLAKRHNELIFDMHRCYNDAYTLQCKNYTEGIALLLLQGMISGSRDSQNIQIDLSG